MKARRAIESAPAVLDQLADEVNRGTIDIGELSRFVEALTDARLLAVFSTHREQESAKPGRGACGNNP